jgi:hypothetical protein
MEEAREGMETSRRDGEDRVGKGGRPLWVRLSYRLRWKGRDSGAPSSLQEWAMGSLTAEGGITPGNDFAGPGA